MSENSRWTFRQGHRVPRRVYRGEEPLFMAATEELAAELVTLLNASAPVPDQSGVGGNVGELVAPLLSGFRRCEELCRASDSDIPDDAEIYVRGAKRSSLGLFTYGDLRRLAALLTQEDGR